MGKSTISMAIFDSYVSLPEGINWYPLSIQTIIHWAIEHDPFSSHDGW